MKVNCLSCGHKGDLDDAYDDYEGPVKCFGCGAVLEISAEQGSLKAVRNASIVSHSPTEELRVLVGTQPKEGA